MEEWKTIENCNGLYQVSSFGRVKSLWFNKERILKLGLNRHGYLVVALWCNGKQKTKAVHKLVAMAFLNHKPSGMKFVVDHINDVATDNRVENLQIVTQRFNACKTQGNYSSKYKGVSWNKKSKKWKSDIYLNGKKKYLGLFSNEEEASEAYQSALLTV